MKWKLFVVIILAVLLVSGCVFNDFFAVTPKPGETPEEHKARQEVAAAKVATGASVLLGVLSVVWPPGVAIIGTAFVVIRKYRLYHTMLVAVIKAIEKAAPGKAIDVPVKAAVQGLFNPELDREVYKATHPAI